MRKSRFSQEQIIGILKEHQAGLAVAEICRRHGIRYHRVTTDTPYGIVLREALAPSPRTA